jgi:hypothetical protein
MRPLVRSLRDAEEVNLSSNEVSRSFILQYDKYKGTYNSYLHNTYIFMTIHV